MSGKIYALPLPLTKEQVEKVRFLLLKAAEHLMPDGHKYQGAAIEILKGAA